ncbi:hypothetical protein A1D22_00925 [Pasteurellaceae bacterium LFhippo2]|nr:hypothetical protein [Pasteurellaceae bacterium LFhippo2]
MKLSKIAGVVIAVVGVVAAGGSWYTGKQVEERYQEILAKANKQLKSLEEQGIQAEIANANIKRGLFSSDVTYQLKAKIDGKDYVAAGNDTLYHGPLPLNRLTQGKFVPVLASAKSKLAAVSEDLKSAFNGSDILEGQSEFSYAGDVTADIKMKSWALADGSLALGDSEYAGSFNVNSKYAELSEGDFDFKISSLKLADDTNPDVMIAVDNLEVKGESRIKGERYISPAKLNGQISMQSKSSQYVANLGKLTLDLDLDVDAKAMDELIPYSNEAVPFNSNEASKAFENLFSKGLDLKLKEFSLDNAKGKSHFNLLLGLKSFNAAELNDLNKILATFKPSSLDVNLNLKALEQLSTDLARLQGVDESEAVASAQSMVSELVNSAKQSFGLAKVDAESVKINIKVENGKVAINDKEMSESELQGLMFMLMLGAGSLGL